MIISRLILKNWRNFREVDVALRDRQFIVGANAAGKSNLLDVFRFLRDLTAQPGGGLQEAICHRGGMEKIRHFGAYQSAEVVIGVCFADADTPQKTKWRYEIGIAQTQKGQPARLTFEKVWDSAGNLILNRPDDDDKNDPARLLQTHLEYVGNNKAFRVIAEHLSRTAYLHLVPQLIRHADEFQANIIRHDPFGQGLLAAIANTPEEVRKARLAAINELMKEAIPQLHTLDFVVDGGKPHLVIHSTGLREYVPEQQAEELCESAGDLSWQEYKPQVQEDQFSDGALRLFGLLWASFSNDALLLVEEPELSLHVDIAASIPPILHQAQMLHKYKTKQPHIQQALVTTQSPELFADNSVAAEEILFLDPGKKGTTVQVASESRGSIALMEVGISTGELVTAHTRASLRAIG